MAILFARSVLAASYQGIVLSVVRNPLWRLQAFLTDTTISWLIADG